MRKGFQCLLLIAVWLTLTSANVCSSISSSTSTSPRLLQSNVTEGETFDFVTAIYKNEEFLCTGILVSPRYIMTAAHCFFDKDTGELKKSDIVVRIGTKSSTYDSGESGVIERDAAYVITHQNFTEKGYTLRRRNDLALLRFTFFVAAISPVNLPGSDTPLPSKGITFGWGSTVLNGSISESLRQVELQVRSEDECLGPFPYLQNDHFCAGELGKAACPGDDGGPFLAQVDGKWTLFGVVNDAQGCGQKDTYTLFTNVLKHSTFLYGKETPFSNGKLYGGFLCSSGSTLSLSSLFMAPLLLLLYFFSSL